MREYLKGLKCNITVTVPVDVLNELDNLVNREVSRNKIVNKAIVHYLKDKYRVAFSK